MNNIVRERGVDFAEGRNGVDVSEKDAIILCKPGNRKTEQCSAI